MKKRKKKSKYFIFTIFFNNFQLKFNMLLYNREKEDKADKDLNNS